MTWDPGPMKFWEGVYEHPKEFFDPNDEARIQAEYFLAHPEIQALASLLVAHMVTGQRKNVLKDAGYFFTRPASVLQAEVDDFLKKTDKFGLRDEMRKKYKVNPLPRPGPVPDCECSSLTTPSFESVYSSFISKSSSASTLPSIIAKKREERTLSLDEEIWRLVTRALNNALNNMYAARDHAIYYDEAYLCLMTCVQTAVETVWGPRLIEIYDIIESLIDDVRRITSEKRKLKLLMTDKLPIKVNRLMNKFKGYAEKEDYPELKKKEISKTLKPRKGTYNRYPKDLFGVYLPTYDKSLDVSTTYVPHACEDSPHSSSSLHSAYGTMDELSVDDLDENEYY